MATFYAWTTMNLPTSSRYMSPPMGKDSQEDNRIPFPVKSGNGSTRMSIFLRGPHCGQCPRPCRLKMPYSRLLFSQPMMMMMKEFFKPNVNTQTQKATYFSHEIKNNNCPIPSLIGKSKSVQGHNNSSSEPKVML